MLVASSCGGGNDVALDASADGNGGGAADAGAADGAQSGDSQSADNPSGGVQTGDAQTDGSADNDQDGVTTGDNCPTVFNPDQADDDADGIGNPCDDSVPVGFPCGFSGSASSELSGSGDSSVTTLCQPMMADDPPPPWVELGEVLVADDTYVIIDYTDDQLARAKDLGLESVIVDSVASRNPTDLAELRIERDPASALATADPTVLADVRPEVLKAVPAEVLAAQPDRTLAAIPDQFWVDAPQTTIDAVGAERLSTLYPNLERLDPSAATKQGLSPDTDLTGISTTTIITTTTATTTTTAASKSTSTAPAGQDLSDG